MQKFQIDKKTLIYIIFYAFMAADIFFIIPVQVRNLTKINREAKDFKRKISLFRQSVLLKDSLIQGTDEAKRVVAELDSRIITSGETSAVSVYVSTKARETGVDIEEIITGKQVEYQSLPEGKFFHLPLKIECKGAYHNLAQFICAVESGTYCFRVKNLAIKGSAPYHGAKINAVVLLKE